MIERIALNTNNTLESIKRPSIVRNSRGQIRWNFPDNTPEQNLHLGVGNIQAIFLEKNPEFDALFPRGQEGQISEGKREEAKTFIEEHIGNDTEFGKFIRLSPVAKTTCPYFEGSLRRAIEQSFSPWGIEFTVSQDQAGQDLFPRDSRGKIDWASLEDKPEEIDRLIELWAESFILQGHELTQNEMRRQGLYGISQAIIKYYPGKLYGLKEKMGMKQDQRQWGYWRDPKRIEAEVRRFVAEGNELTQKALSRAKLSTLSRAINTFYPGGLRQLRLNLSLYSPRNPKGSWTNDRIEQEALEFYQREGKLSQGALVKSEKHDLNSAISEIYGGMRKLKRNLGLKIENKGSGYWTREQIEIEAKEFFETHGRLSQKALAKYKRHDLYNAINKHYPGGIIALKGTLGINEAVDSLSANESHQELQKLLEAV